MKKKIAIVTSGHPYYDERIFCKFARTLNKNGYEVSIICSTTESEVDLVKDNIHIIGFNGSSLKKSQKVSKFFEFLKSIKPDLIICCEPLPILAANKIRRQRKNVRIIYDVTEWYPENVAFKLSGINKYITYITLFILNILASNLSDVIIIGETVKKKRYNVIAPFKQKCVISYFPVIESFNYSPPKFDSKKLVLCYAGLIKFDRGIEQLFQVAQRIAERHKELEIILKLVGRFESNTEEKEFENLVKDSEKLAIEIMGWSEYPEISKQISNAHICFDLRDRNFIYNNSLPIKIFEYMACGKPYIFTDIKPLREEADFEKCGFLVNPYDLDDIVDKVEKYLNNQDMLALHSKTGRMLIEKSYNWEKESMKLLELLNSLNQLKHS